LKLLYMYVDVNCLFSLKYFIKYIQLFI
jgi:hypothetical protein